MLNMNFICFNIPKEDIRKNNFIQIGHNFPPRDTQNLSNNANLRVHKPINLDRHEFHANSATFLQTRQLTNYQENAASQRGSQKHHNFIHKVKSPSDLMLSIIGRIEVAECSSFCKKGKT